jgi:hypothetical protein
MTEAQVLHAFYANPIGELMRDTTWLYGVCQTLHFIGLTTLFGAILLVDLRMLGLFRNTPIRAFMPLIPVAIGGFALNLVTGAMFFTFDPVNFWHNKGFLLKLAALAVAGVNALWFTIGEQPRVLKLADGEATDAATKISAGLSITVWMVVIVCGRLIKVYTP